MRILAGDIGGTKVLLQLCDISEDVRIIATKSYASQSYDSLNRIATEFLAETARDTAPPAAACFAVAGPVRDFKARITNLPWLLDAKELAQQLHIGEVLLVNDMQGVGHGIDELEDAELSVLQAGVPEIHGPRAIIAAGTGLGEGAMVWHQDRYVMRPAEGGHADFAPRDELELELLRHLLTQMGQVLSLIHISEPTRRTPISYA